MASKIRYWLEAAGLGKYAGNFANITEDGFLSLLMSEYQNFGVVDMEDKQRLFRCIILSI